MKRIFTALILCVSIFTASVQKSHAVIGLLTAQSSTIAVGGVIMLMGGIAELGGVTERSHSVFEFLAGHGSLGLLILDGDQEGEIVFSKLEEGPALAHFSAQDIATYNSELEELNSIQQTVAAEIAVNKKIDPTACWASLSNNLSDATLKIAAFNGQQLMSALSK